MKTGIELIAEERREQIDKHGFDRDHDDEWEKEELVLAALYYTMPDEVRVEEDDFSVRVKPVMFFEKTGWDWKAFENKLRKSRIQQLVVAGALIAAEIDRLQRLEVGSCRE